MTRTAVPWQRKLLRGGANEHIMNKGRAPNLPAKAEPTTTTSGISSDMPILAMTGNSIIPATVCDTNVATVPQKKRIHMSATHGWASGSAGQPDNMNNIRADMNVQQGRYSGCRLGICSPEMIPSARYSSSPEDSTALPKTLPPPTRASVCHDSELKST